MSGPQKAIDKSKENKIESTEISDDEIDVRLDHDLSNFTLPPEKPIYTAADIDIDLEGPLSDEAEMAQTQVLDVNPLKSFSRHVDLNLNHLSNKGYVTPTNVSTPLSYTFRSIKRPLLNNVQKKGATVVDNANLIMVTSSLSGEGKTYTAINLALSMAMERDTKVLLVDADISKPSHHEIFGIDIEYGLTDYLTGKVTDVSKIINKTDIPSLSLMFAGGTTSHTIELMASQSMTSFVSELSSRYEDRVIVFDSAPLLLPTEASVLASLMGQVIVVVEAEYTAQENVKRSVDMLNNRIVLLVLNKTRQGNDIGSYGYYGHATE